MKKLFKRDTILAMVIPFVFIWTSQPLGFVTVKTILITSEVGVTDCSFIKLKEYRVRSVEDYENFN